MTNEEVKLGLKKILATEMEQINYLKSIIEDEIRVSGNKILEKKYNKIINKTKKGDSNN